MGSISNFGPQMARLVSVIVLMALATLGGAMRRGEVEEDGAVADVVAENLQENAENEVDDEFPELKPIKAKSGNRAGTCRPGEPNMAYAACEKKGPSCKDGCYECKSGDCNFCCRQVVGMFTD